MEASLCCRVWPQTHRDPPSAYLGLGPQIVLLQAGGDTFPLIGNSGTVLGMALKSHDHSTKPLYVSVGHRISLEVAVRLTHCCCRFRIPEPIRQADIRSREYIRRTLGQHGESPAQKKDRSQKEQRPNACPQEAQEHLQTKAS